MKIDLIIPNLKYGGAEKVVISLAQSLCDKGHITRLILREKMHDNNLIVKNDKVKISYLNAEKVRNFPFTLLKFYLNKSNRPHFIIANLFPLTFLTSVIVKIFYKEIKVICVEHGSLKIQEKRNYYNKFLIRTYHLFCKQLVVVSNLLKKEILDISFFNPKNIKVIYNPIENHFSYNPDDTFLKQKRKNIINADHVFLGVGKLKKVKNFPLMIEAFTQTLKINPNIILIIVGDGEEQTKLNKLIKVNELEDKVYLTGYKSNMGDYYSISDTLISSSNSEAFGNTIVEALHFNLNIISTNCFGPSEILKDQPSSLLCEINDSSDMSSKMLEILTRNRPKKINNSSLEKYNPTQIAIQYIDIMKKMTHNE